MNSGKCTVRKWCIIQAQAAYYFSFLFYRLFFAKRLTKTAFFYFFLRRYNLAWVFASCTIENRFPLSSATLHQLRIPIILKASPTSPVSSSWSSTSSDFKGSPLGYSSGVFSRFYPMNMSQPSYSLRFYAPIRILPKGVNTEKVGITNIKKCKQRA